MSGDGGKAGKADPGQKPPEADQADLSKIKGKLPFGKKLNDQKAESQKPRKKYTFNDRIRDIKTGFAEIKKNIKDKKAQKDGAKTSTIPTSGKTSASSIKSRATSLLSLGASKGSGRPMLFPYTFSAKIAQFPFRFHYDNGWMFKYYWYGVVLCIPVFMYIGQKSYSPANVTEWKEKRRQDFTPHH